MLYDISQTLRHGLPVWPGDTAFRLDRTWSMGAGVPVNVSSLTLSTHSGTHADAPFHYDPQGQAVGALPLATFLGPCRVVHALDAGALVRMQHLAHALQNLPPRLLVRTCRQFPLARFDDQLTAFHPDTVSELADLGVMLSIGNFGTGYTSLAALHQMPVDVEDGRAIFFGVDDVLVPDLVVEGASHSVVFFQVGQ